MKELKEKLVYWKCGGGSLPYKWGYGYWTGPQKDLLCLKPNIKTNKEAELWLVPIQDSKELAKKVFDQLTSLLSQVIKDEGERVEIMTLKDVSRGIKKWAKKAEKYKWLKFATNSKYLDDAWYDWDEVWSSIMSHIGYFKKIFKYKPDDILQSHKENKNVKSKT